MTFGVKLGGIIKLRMSSLPTSWTGPKGALSSGDIGPEVRLGQNRLFSKFCGFGIFLRAGKHRLA